MPPLNSINILGLQISSSLSWRDHTVQIAKSASKKLGFSFGVSSILILFNYSNCIPALFIPIWNIALKSRVLPLILLFAIGLNQRLCLTGDPSLTSTLDRLSLHWKVTSPSLFYRYYSGHCSDELAACIPPPMVQPHSTRQASFAHNYCVELSNARINRFSDGFFPSGSRL